MIKVVFFARLKEQLQCETKALPAEGLETVAAVRSRLMTDHPAWVAAFSEPLLTAVNQQMVKDTARVSDGDEVAFFPPVTGG